jgi:hypothetical protein
MKRFEKLEYTDDRSQHIEEACVAALTEYAEKVAYYNKMTQPDEVVVDLPKDVFDDDDVCVVKVILHFNDEGENEFFPALSYVEVLEVGLWFDSAHDVHKGDLKLMAKRIENNKKLNGWD